MYGYYHEHFEIANWGKTVRVTCVCGKDFIWSVISKETQVHACPYCREKWVLSLEGNTIVLTRKKTQASAKLHLSKTHETKKIITHLFPHVRRVQAYKLSNVLK